jgi:2-oxoisovalerate ferredoxin oxidoreductase beta subunit
MTGGQLAPTTPLGETTTTSPFGRREKHEGPPLRVAELLAALEAPVYIERVALTDNKNIMRARRAVRKALDLQRAGAGFTLVEVLSPCPTIWKKTPVEAQKWVAGHMLPVFPLGVYRDKKPEPRPATNPPRRSLAEVLEVKTEEQLECGGGRGAGSHSAISVKAAGFGGQGILLLGQILAEMGMREGREVSWLPSYGPEMRSGSAYCDVNLSSEAIGSPLVTHPDVLIAMNELSLRKFAGEVPSSGLILYNAAKLPEDFPKPEARIVTLPASDIADKLGSAKAGNVVMLGALLASTQSLSPETARAVLKAKIKDPKLLEIDGHALEAGMALAA